MSDYTPPSIWRRKLELHCRMRILVTGVAGFIGSHLAEGLLADGHTVVGVDAFIEAYPRSLKERNLANFAASPRFEFHEADLRTHPLEPMLAGCDAVINEAAMAGLSRSWTEFELYSSCNLGAVARLVDAARRTGVRRFVQVSTSSVYGRMAVGNEDAPTRPNSPYGVTKLAAENLLQAHADAGDLSLLILRYFSVYGPRQRPDMAFRIFTEAMLREIPVVIFGDGSQSRTNTYVDDIVRGTIDGALSSTTGIYNLSGSVALSVNDIIRLIGAALGVTPTIQYSDERLGDQQQTAGDFGRANAAFGYRPEVGPEEGIARQVAWSLAQEG
jgi:nucleoside-diphosphate-sugar epimerase